MSALPARFAGPLESIRTLALGSPDAHLVSMAATKQFPNLHTLAGARWLAPFLVVLLAIIMMGFVMLLYPHLTG